MSKRYQHSRLKKDTNGKRHRETTIHPKLEKELGDLYIMSKRGDRLDAYAKKYYNNVSDWVVIAQANKLGKGTMIVPPGIQIRIPKKNTDYDNLVGFVNRGL
jgi:hypothetical protein